MTIPLTDREIGSLDYSEWDHEIDMDDITNVIDTYTISSDEIFETNPEYPDETWEDFADEETVNLVKRHNLEGKVFEIVICSDEIGGADGWIYVH